MAAKTNLEFQINHSVAPDSFDATSFTYNNVNILQVGTTLGDGPHVTFGQYGFDLNGPNGQVEQGTYDDSCFSSAYAGQYEFTYSPGLPAILSS